MTDKKLLVLAAKAARFIVIDAGGLGLLIESEGCKTGYMWNPLTDDGDALRLAVKLGMQILIGDGGMCHASSGENGQVFSIYGADRGAATRKAIVRAAAEIGKGK